MPHVKRVRDPNCQSCPCMAFYTQRAAAEAAAVGEAQQGEKRPKTAATKSKSSTRSRGKGKGEAATVTAAAVEKPSDLEPKPARKRGGTAANGAAADKAAAKGAPNSRAAAVKAAAPSSGKPKPVGLGRGGFSGRVGTEEQGQHTTMVMCSPRVYGPGWC